MRSVSVLALALAAAPAGAFLLARPTPFTQTPWDAESNPPLTREMRALGAGPWRWEPLPDAEAVCLDGSQYGLVTCFGSGPIKTIYVSIEGGESARTGRRVGDS